MRAKFGNTMLIATISLLGLLTIAELQYWTLRAFDVTVTSKSGEVVSTTASYYPRPAVTLDWTGSIASGVTIATVVLSGLAIFLLIGQRCLLGLAATWITLGLTASSHFYGPGETAWWVLGPIALAGAFLPLSWAGGKVRHVQVDTSKRHPAAKADVMP